MKEIQRIQDQLTRAFEGDAWYGPSLRELLADVTAEKARARPIARAHSIWEIILHMAAWQGAVRIRLEGGPVEVPAEGDWPAVTDTSEAAWRELLSRLERRHSELLQTMSRLSETELEEFVGEDRDRATGGGVSGYVTLHGIIQHNVYHAGQIALLKKA